MVSPGGVIATEWSLFTIAFLLVGARVMVHLLMNMKPLLFSDTFLLLATLSCLGLVICDTLTYKAGAMSNFTDPTIFILKVRFATGYFFDVGLYFPKFSILAFYFRIIPRTAPETRKALHGVTCFVVLSSLIAFFGDTFWCGSDPAINWSINEGACATFTSNTLFKINWSLDFCSQMLIFFLPFPLLRHLNFRHKRERAGLLVVFLLGAITIIVSSVRFIAMLLLSNYIGLYILAATESTVSIMIPSLISLRPLLRKIHGWTSSGHSGPPFSRSSNTGVTSGKRPNKNTGSSWQKDSRVLYSKGNGGNIYGSEVELTEQELGRIYKTEEISVTSTREPQLGDDDKISG